jgi:hypothetical protein
MNKITTIKISKNTTDFLNELKIHPRQSYEEVILEILSNKLPANDIKYLTKSKKITTIKVSKKTVKILNSLKIHPRQSYEEAILKLLSKLSKNAKK